MRRLLLIGTMLGLLGACTTVKKSDMVPTGERKIGERFSVTLAPVWNESPLPGPAFVWTIDGVPIDQMLIYPGIKDCEPIHATARGAPAEAALTFRAGMQPDQIVALFEGLLSRGGTFQLAKVEPWTFANAKGARFEFMLERRTDNLPRSGVGYAVVSDGELFAMLYTAPRLGFFARNRPHFETIAKTAKIGPKRESTADAPVTACSDAPPAAGTVPQNTGFGAPTR